MHLLFQTYADIMQNLHDELETAISDLPQEALDWVPGDDMNSIAALVMHCVGATRYLIGDLVLGDRSERDRNGEFTTSGVDETTLKQVLKDNITYIHDTMERYSMNTLEDMKQGRTTQVSVSWCFLHAMEHMATHVGHVHITRQLWDQRNS